MQRVMLFRVLLCFLETQKVKDIVWNGKETMKNGAINDIKTLNQLPKRFLTVLKKQTTKDYHAVYQILGNQLLFKTVQEVECVQ